MTADPTRIARLRAQGEAQSALTAAALAFFAMEFEGAPHPPAEQVRADFAAAVHGYRAAVGQ